jgi:5-methylthioadenosine/S-adenosylhomocysteine deaminase
VADDVEAGALLAIAEMLDNGVTAFADHYFSAERICKAVVETGIRADIAPTLFGSLGDMEGQLSRSAELISEWQGRAGRISMRLGPHSPYTCSPRDLELCAAEAQRLGVGAHIHVEDSESQIQASVDKYGAKPLEVVARSGLMEVPLIIGHGYWITEEEEALVKDRTWMAVCMKTYMKLGEGPGRSWALREGFPLCIGTDGAASSNSLSPLEQARLLGLVGKYMLKDAEAFPLKRLWRILMRGHDALPFRTGSLEAEAPADFLVWDLRKPNSFPVYDPLAAIIYSSDARNVLHSVIDGRFVKRDGKLLLDVDGIVERAGSCARGILERGKGRTSLVF